MDENCVSSSSFDEDERLHLTYVAPVIYSNLLSEEFSASIRPSWGQRSHWQRGRDFLEPDRRLQSRPGKTVGGSTLLSFSQILGPK